MQKIYIGIILKIIVRIEPSRINPIAKIGKLYESEFSKTEFEFINFENVLSNK